MNSFDFQSSKLIFYFTLFFSGATVAAADLIVPDVGELTGGSAREHRLDRLEDNIRNGL